MKQIINFFLILTGVFAIFLIIGFGGGLDGNLITLEQYCIYCAILLVYIAFARIVYVLLNKNAPRYWHTERANKKYFVGCIIQQIGEKSNE